MDKLKMHSPDLTEANIAKLAELFPNCVTEIEEEEENHETYEKHEKKKYKKAIDFDLLRQELAGTIVEGPQERYHLNWPGKREALLVANAPIAKTLRPCREESVDFDTTENLFIEGDNLDALKLLQETYLGKVKMIYIDPPYNTGNDFIYEDDFAESAEEYLRKSNQKDEQGNRLVANTESNGRFHSDWLSMMYPRLKLARNLLRDDGVIFISIDDGEVSNLRKICSEVFGEDKFIAQLIWKSRQNKDNRTKNGVSVDHEYVIAYGKSIRGADRDLRGYSNPDNDYRGDWTSANMVGLATSDRRPNLHYDLINPRTGVNYGCPPMGWRYDKSTMDKLISEKRILWPASPGGRPRRKSFVNELSAERTGYSSIIGDGIYTRSGTAEIVNLFGNRFMDFPKPITLVKGLIDQAAENDDIILDFFSGSCTTANAVMQLNAEDGGNRKFIMVQLPEPCDEKSEAFKAGYKTIAEIGKERIRRAGRKIQEELATKNKENKQQDLFADSERENVRGFRDFRGSKKEEELTTKNTNHTKNENQALFPEAEEETIRDFRAFRGSKTLDTGFRVLKVDSSNMEDIYYNPDALNQKQLSLFAENIKEDRSTEDLLFQVLLDWGVDLSLPIRKEMVSGKEVFFVDENALAACFVKNGEINEDFCKALAERKPLRVVFRDAGFKDDSVKINVEQIFKLMSPHTEVKTI